MSYDINLKHLEYFIKVARLGSINKAAQMLYVSQSHLGKILHWSAALKQEPSGRDADSRGK